MAEALRTAAFWLASDRTLDRALEQLEVAEERASAARRSENRMRGRIDGLEHSCTVFKGRNDARITLITTLRKNHDSDMRANELIEWWMSAGLEIPEPLLEAAHRSRGTDAEREAIAGVWRFLKHSHLDMETDPKRQIHRVRSNEELDAEALGRESVDDWPAIPKVPAD